MSQAHNANCISPDQIRRLQPRLLVLPENHSSMPEDQQRIFLWRLVAPLWVNDIQVGQFPMLTPVQQFLSQRQVKPCKICICIPT